MEEIMLTLMRYRVLNFKKNFVNIEYEGKVLLNIEYLKYCEGFSNFHKLISVHDLESIWFEDD